jgi:translation initiation factor 1A
VKFNYQQENVRLPLPETNEDEMFAIVNRVLGGSRMDVQCSDGKSRLARIPGGKRRGMGRIRIGDLLIISPWDIQNEKADVLHRYNRYQAKFLSKKNMLPLEVDVF